MDLCKTVLCLATIVCSVLGQDECKYKKNDYQISWEVAGDNIYFDLTVKSGSSSDFWTGIGFGKGMNDMDFIQIMVKSGTPKISDTYSEWYGRPANDNQKDVTMEKASFSNGILKARFYRKLNTGDTKDKALDNGCQYFIFPYTNGEVRNGRIQKHDRTPEKVQKCNVRQRCFKKVDTPPVVDNNPSVPKKCGYKRDNYDISWQVQGNLIVFDLIYTPKQTGNYWTGLAFGTSMSKLDFIQVSVVGKKAKVTDSYTKGYFQPYEDEQNDITTESSFITDGQLKIRFAREMNTADNNDVNLATGCITFQFPYAGGPINGNQIRKHYKRPEAVQKCNIASTCRGHGSAAPTFGGQGSATNDAVKEVKEIKDIVARQGCSYSNTGYNIAWEVVNGMVNFDLKVSQQSRSGNIWSGVGFGEGMQDLDFIQVTVDSSGVKVRDTYARWKGAPAADSQSDLKNIESSFNNGQLRAKFSRKVNTGDKNDKSLSGCVTFQFPVSGGPVRNGQLREHYRVPRNKQFCDIEKKCAKQMPDANAG